MLEERTRQKLEPFILLIPGIMLLLIGLAALVLVFLQ